MPDVQAKNYNPPHNNTKKPWLFRYWSDYAPTLLEQVSADQG